MADGILNCLNLNLSMHFRVGSKNHVTTVNETFQPLPIFCHKELHLRCCIGLELNIVTWSTKILKGIGGGNLHDLVKIWKTHPPRCPKNAFPEVFRITFFAFSVKWTKLSWYQFIDVCCVFTINFCVVCLVNIWFHQTQLNSKISL